MKSNKCKQLGAAGIVLLAVGAAWDILVTTPDLFRNIVITLPPTYQILELVGLGIIVYAIYCHIKTCKKETEEA